MQHKSKPPRSATADQEPVAVLEPQAEAGSTSYPQQQQQWDQPEQQTPTAQPMPTALVTPARAQFPPPGSIPATLPPLGRVPRGWTDLVVNFGPKATHFSGPIVSGSPTANHMIQHAWGTAQLVLPLRLDHSMGQFEVPLQFPHDAILLSMISVGVESFVGAAANFDLYTQPNFAGTQVGSVNLANAGVQNNNDAYAPLPGAGAVLPEKPFLVYASSDLTGATAGSCIVLLLFARVTPNWF